MPAIVVPTINSNDTDALLVAWVKAPGETVRVGETIATLETTKASFELTAEHDGELQITAAPGQRYAFGSTIGHVIADSTERQRVSGIGAIEAPSAGSDFVLTKSAHALIEQHRITEAQLRSLGKRVIKSEDLACFISTSAAAEESSSSLPLQQQTIARVVSQSKREIPHSFTLKRVNVDAALEALTAYGREQKTMVSLPDLIVWLLARIAPAHPTFFGALDNQLRHRPSTVGNIGVTFDVGNGLYIPVVRGAANLSLREIARQMMGFRMRAARNSFKAEDLTGGDISLSINTDRDVVLVMPVILPPQTCMVSLGSTLTELVLAEGQVRNQRYANLGVAFDHRIINGYHANAFLNDLKEGLEAPDWQAWG